MNVSKLIETFMLTLHAEVQSGLLKPATEDWYFWQLKKLEKSAGEIAASELRIHHLAKMKLGHHLVRAIKRLIRWACDEDHLSRDHFRKLRTPRCGKRKRTLKPVEVLRLYRHMSPEYRECIFVTMHTAARPGEIRNLRWDQVHIDQRVIRLEEFKAKDLRQDGVEVRVIPLSKAVCRRLAKLRTRSTAEYVFARSDGKPRSATAVRCAMREARERAGLDVGEKVVWYTLRHTEATNRWRRGMDVLTLSRTLGHTDLAMTKRYVHANDQDLVRAVDAAASR